MEAVTMLTGSASDLITVAELQAMPDDGRRKELVDGVLVVTPAPSVHHQRILGRLFLLMAPGCPDELELFFAPLDVVLGEHDLMEPDLLVARREDLTEKNLPTAPLLAVEVLSPSTRQYDLHVKKDRLRRAGCPSYWVVDPDGPSLTAWELRGEDYVEVAEVVGDEEFQATAPYPVVISPIALMG